MKAFKTKTDGLVPAGTVCFPFAGYDYGLASDDTRATGRQHQSYTTKMFGGPPSFTHPVDDLEEVEVEPLAPPDDQYALTTCKVGAGASCCRYLTMGAGGLVLREVVDAGILPRLKGGHGRPRRQLRGEGAKMTITFSLISLGAFMSAAAAYVRGREGWHFTFWAMGIGAAVCAGVLEAWAQ